VTFLRTPWNAVGVALLIFVAIYHMMMGMQEVILDYLAKPFGRAAFMILNLFFCAILASAALWALLQINFGW
jgi:succinate dehydrogenase hydrophobic anchor subunit